MRKHRPEQKAPQPRAAAALDSGTSQTSRFPLVDRRPEALQMKQIQEAMQERVTNLPMGELSSGARKVHGGRLLGPSLEDARSPLTTNQVMGGPPPPQHKPIQRSEDLTAPDLSEPTLGKVSEEQQEAIDTARLTFKTDVGNKMIEMGMVAKPKIPSGFFNIYAWNPWKKALPPHKIEEVVSFESAAWKAIDTLLPQLLHHIPFENGLAAIRFAQDIFLKFLRQHPRVLEEGKLDEVLLKHLKEVVAYLPLSEEENMEDEEEEEKIKISTAGKEDKRYKAAILRIRGDKDNSQRTFSLTEQEGRKNSEKDERLFDKEKKRFEDCFQKKDKQGAKTIVEYAEKMKTTLLGVRFLRLLIMQHQKPRESAAFLYELHHSFEGGYGVSVSSHSQERKKLGELFVSLGLLSKEEVDLFNTGTGIKDEEHPIYKMDHSIQQEEKKRNTKKGQLIKEDKRLKQEREKKQRETQKQEYDILLKQVPNKVVQSLSESKLNLDGPSHASIFLLKVLVKAAKGGDAGLLENYEDYFALRSWVPGNPSRLKTVDKLRQLKLLPQVDQEILKYGVRSSKAITEDAIKGGWATREEIEVGMKLLGPKAFVGILDSHMRRQKPGPLRAMIEQIVNHRDLIKLAPPLTSTSLILDTNMVEIAHKPFSQLSKSQKHLRVQLNQVIEEKGITDIRLANMNIAELSGFGRLLGTTMNVQLNGIKGKKQAPRKKLPVFGVPYNTSRGSGKYNDVFEKMKEKKVGENKGDADRSMMADIYMADREKDAIPHFATADLGVAEEIGESKGQFNPKEMGLPSIGIHTMKPLLHESSLDSQSSGQVTDRRRRKRKHAIWDFPVGQTHTAFDVAQMIQQAGYRMYVVGGAVRDFIRASKLNDVDMKTDMPAFLLQELLEEKGLSVSVTPAIKLVKVGQGDDSIDIVSTSMKKPTKLDLEADAKTRDFTLNALYLDPTKKTKKGRDEPVGSKDAEKHAASGLLRFTADPGAKVDFSKRAKAIIEHLEEKPVNFGRALKFLQRGHKEWEQDRDNYTKRMSDYKKAIKERSHHKKKSKRKIKKKLRKPIFQSKFYHLEAEVLDLLRKNAIHILKPLTDPKKGPDTKGIFIHQSGFKTPMELVDVMRRLNFPPKAIQMVYPDTVAGAFQDRQLAYSRHVSPRYRSTGPVSAWNPKAAPKVKVDTITGRIYQYRVYAYAKVKKAEERLLIDVDYSDHGVKGHPSPHYHVYRIIDGVWKKNQSGYSNTGQPGEPPLTFVDGRRKFEGPITWTWWDFDAQKDKGDDQALKKALDQAANRAGITLTYSKAGDSVDIGGQITLPMVRLHQLAEHDRLPKLLLLVHNLNQGKQWNEDDEAVKELTGSKDMRERLRFKPQLEKVAPFLKDICGIEDPNQLSSKKQLTEEEQARLFDIYKAGYSREMCKAAAKYAIRKMGRSPDVFLFVNHFEYYIAATKNKVGQAELDLLHKRTVNHAGSAMAGEKVALDGKDLKAEIKRKAKQLKFKDNSTAVYHLHKHLDMVSQSAEEIRTRNKHMWEAGDEYMAICHRTVSEGHCQKMVPETTHTLKLYYENENKVAIVEYDTKSQKAHLLTCYSTNTASPIFLTTQYLPSPNQSQKDKKSKQPPPQKEKLYRTPFGPYVKKYTSPDGNCFFTAVKQSADLGQSVKRLRELAVGELEANYTRRFNGTTYTDFMTGSGKPKEKAEAAAKYLKGDGHWSADDGDLVPELMARALNRTIHILSMSTGGLVQTMGPPNRNPIVIFYNGGSHYETAIRQGRPSD